MHALQYRRDALQPHAGIHARLGQRMHLAPLVTEGVHLVGPMSPGALREAIEEPAHRAGLRLESGLVEEFDLAGCPMHFDLVGDFSKPPVRFEIEG